MESYANLIAHELNLENFRDLISGKLMGIWCRSYVEKNVCERALRPIKSLVGLHKYTLTSDLQSLATSIGEAHESLENENAYFAGSVGALNLIRNVIFQGALSPVDRVRLEMDEIWPSGATIGKYESRLMLPATIRRWSKGGQANPHIDQKDIKLLRHMGLKARVGMNVYLQTPDQDQGGGLEFWKRIFTESEYESVKRADYGLDRSLIGPPDIVLYPRMGDMIMFNAGFVHGVEEVREGNRVTAACFFGVSEETSPLTIFA